MINMIQEVTAEQIRKSGYWCYTYAEIKEQRKSKLKQKIPIVIKN